MPDKFGNPTPEEVAAAQAVLAAAANPVPEPAPDPVVAPEAPAAPVGHTVVIDGVTYVPAS